MMRESRGNMYDFVTHTWNAVKGKCPHDCEYCYMKIFKLNKIRFDEKELDTKLGENNFIFVGSSCDMFANSIPNEWIKKTLYHCNLYKKNKYLFQSKNPVRIATFILFLPKNSVIGTTIETNREYKQMGKTPTPMQRAIAMGHLSKYFETMVTIEPIMDFDVDELVGIIKIANPKWINIGADSKRHNLPEPDEKKIKELIRRLSEFTTIRKKNNLTRLTK